MSVQKLIAYHAALNNFDSDVVEAMFTEDAEYVSPGLHGVVTGRSAIMKAMRDYFAEYADQKAFDDEVSELRPGVIQSKWRLEATSLKTGKSIKRRGREVTTFNGAGLIVRVEVFDAD
ncbi:MAG: nuclear transport factor 2 family protein [Aestuariivirga sp.]